jgi:hypothetical protein
MSPIRLLGLGIAAAGIVLLVLGLNATDSPVDQVSHLFTGKYTHETIMYIAGGLAALIAGGVMALTRRADR